MEIEEVILLSVSRRFVNIMLKLSSLTYGNDGEVNS